MTVKKPEPLKSIVILGGGTAGWISASVLSHVLQNTDCKINLIESPHIPIIGVGEATIPSFVDLLKFLHISERDFVEKTMATFKLGINFVDWKAKGHSYWHPFGLIGSKIDGKDFYQHWLKSAVQGNSWSLTDFSPAVAMAEKDRFFIPDPRRPGNLSKSAYALHFDAGLAAQYLSIYAKEKGVEHVLDDVVDFDLLPDGHIEQLKMASGRVVQGDFFIDASGSQGLLIDKALKVPYESWERYLPVDTAVVVQSELNGELPPYTTAVAHEHGWRWQIPLRHRMGNGYVFSSRYASKAEAADLLLNQLRGKPLTEPRFINFRTGKRQAFWYKNCLAVGLSSGFIEPLESTSIYLAMKGILSFVQHLPNSLMEQITIDEYNRLMDLEYENIRDFIVLHYCISERNDSAFWRFWRDAEIPDSLLVKMDYFKSQGRLLKNPMDLFASDSWHSIFEGMGLRPRDYDRTVDSSNASKVKKILSDGVKELDRSVELLPTHVEFLHDFITL